jgi:hypothetical protein
MNYSQVFFGLITWLPLCVWISCLVHWAVGGDIDFVSMLVGIAAALVLGVVAIRPPIEILSPIACLVAYLTVFSYPILNSAAQRRAQKRLDVEEVADSYLALGQSPSNSLAKFKLAKAVYKNGLIGHAVAIADTAIPDLPRRIAEEEHRMLHRWKRAGVPPHTLVPIVCIECHTPCQPGWTHCRNCGEPFLLHRLKGQILPGGMARKLVAVWGSAVLFLIGAPLASTLAPPLEALVFVVLIGLLVALLYFSFRRPESLV